MIRIWRCTTSNLTNKSQRHMALAWFFRKLPQAWESLGGRLLTMYLRSSNQTVTSPRRHSPSLYSAQLRTWCFFCFACLYWLRLGYFMVELTSATHDRRISPSPTSGATTPSSCASENHQAQTSAAPQAKRCVLGDVLEIAIGTQELGCGVETCLGNYAVHRPPDRDTFPTQ